MENIKNKNEINNLDIQHIKKNCPICNNIISLEDYQDHILAHEFQFEKGNNVNGFRIKDKNENNISQEKTPQFVNFFKTKINQLMNFNNDDNNSNNISNNNINNINNQNNINNTNNINNINNNISNNNINNDNIDDEDDNGSDSEDALDTVKKNIMPIFSNISDFFKQFSKKNEDSDDSNSSDNDSIIRLPRFSSLRFTSGRRRRRSNSIDEPNTDINDNNNAIRTEELLLEDILNNIKLNDDSEEILRHIPTSTVKEIKKSSENNKCVICLSEFQIGEQESILPCFHIFHSNCIEKWISEKKWCPVCKYDISLKSLLSENNN